MTSRPALTIGLLMAASMLAFAANSALTRAALLDGNTDPMMFAFLRVLSGAITLAGLVLWRGKHLQKVSRKEGVSSLCLALYLIGFSMAYRALDTGTGALILFGGVQIFMFLWAVLSKEQITPWRIIGAGIAFLGLVYLLAPGQGAVDSTGAIWMALGAFGWAGYSILGRRSEDPIANSAVNFVLAVPMLGVAMLVASSGFQVSGNGVVLALLSGIVTSALGYVLWYSVLPDLSASSAAVAQLSVPILAFGMGVIFLGDPASVRFAVASLVVLGGISVSLLPVTKRK